jgi:hypothetical protein
MIFLSRFHCWSVEDYEKQTISETWPIAVFQPLLFTPKGRLKGKLHYVQETFRRIGGLAVTSEKRLPQNASRRDICMYFRGAWIKEYELNEGVLKFSNNP